MIKNKKSILIVLLCLLFSTFIILSITLNNTYKKAVAHSFDNFGWYGWNDAVVNPDVSGNIVYSSGTLYSKEKYPVYYDAQNNKMTVTIKYSINKASHSTHNQNFILSYEPIENAAGVNGQIGNNESVIGLSTSYCDEDQYNKNMLRMKPVSVGDAANNNYGYPTVNPKDKAIHTITWEFDSEQVLIKYDGKYLNFRSTTNPFYFLKQDKSKYTISDFIKDGEPSVYFGLEGNYQFGTTIYNVAYNSEEAETIGFDANRWSNWNGPLAYKTTTDGKVSISGGNYYKDKLNIQNYDPINKTMIIKIEFTMNPSKQYSKHFVPFISVNKIEDWGTTTGKIGKENTDSIIAMRLYYQKEDHWNKNCLLSRVSDYANYQTAVYVNNCSPTDGSTHSLTYIMNEEEVVIKFDNVIMTDSNGIVYKCRKNTTTNYTINDYLVDGEPSIYFGVMTSGFGSVSILNNSFTSEGYAKNLEENIVTSGASIRLDDPTGLRFENKINTTVYNHLSSLGGTNVEMGTLILPKDILGDKELTINTDLAIVGKRTTWFDEENGVYYATLINIPSEKYTRVIVARAYVKFTLNEKDYVVYSDAIERSISEVASLALNDYDKNTIAEKASPATRDDQDGYNYLVTLDNEVSYVYSRYSQEQVDVLKTFVV